MTKQRLNPAHISPEIYQTLVKYDSQINSETSLNPQLIELIKVRVSQLNGCAFCIDTHAKQAVKTGLSERKLLLLNAWSETTIFTEIEKAALQWAESLTFIQEQGAKDEEYQTLQKIFTDKEIVDLTYLVGLINVWNRLAISMTYQLKDE